MFNLILHTLFTLMKGMFLYCALLETGAPRVNLRIKDLCQLSCWDSVR